MVEKTRKGDVTSMEETLAPYLANKTVWWEGDTLVGIASDGVVVELGVRHQPKSIVAYLESHPKQSDW